MVVPPSTVPLVTAGANPALVGNEWIGIVNAGAPGDVQTLGGAPEPGLIRGLHGSPQNGHVVGELFAMAPSVATTKKVMVDKSDVGKTVYVRVLSDGQALGDVTSQTCVIVAPTLPYAAPTTSYGQVPVGPVNGANITFTLDHTPADGTLILTKNGLRLVQGTDFTLSGTTLSLTVAPNGAGGTSSGSPADALYASYRY